jgi:hypothetical protein
MSFPFVVPLELTPTQRKWYVVLGVNPVMSALTPVGVLPVTGEGVPATVLVYAVVSPYWKVTAVDAPFAVTRPLRVAVVKLTGAAEVVTTVGRVIAGVVKVRSPPRVVPAALTPTQRKWYNVDGARPVTFSKTGVSVDPVTSPGVAASVDEYVVVRPYSKVTVVAVVFAFTIPLRVAVVGRMFVAAVVVTVDSTGMKASVVNVRSLPQVVPAVLVAQTW